MKFSLPDIVVFLVYCAIVVSVGIIVSRRVNRKKDANSYFFAGNSLPWFIVGSSVIAANISAEQFIGMSGSGFAMGITIASYEWLAAIMLIMVASFLIISAQMIIVTLLENRVSREAQKWELPSGIFSMKDPVFKWFAAGIVVIICLLYSVLW